MPNNPEQRLTDADVIQKQLAEVAATDAGKKDAIVSASAQDTHQASVPDSVVSEARVSAGDSIANTIDKVTDTVIDAIDSKNSGVTGATRKGSRFVNITGKPTGQKSTAMVRSTRVDYGFALDSQSDFDPMERNTSLASAAFDQMHADIIRESTTSTINGETSVIGIPSDTNVYSEESTKATTTVNGTDVWRGVDDIQSRENGSIFMRDSSIVSVSGDYLHARGSVSGVINDKSHAIQKGIPDQENLLFSRMDSKGMIKPGVGDAHPGFVMPKRGRFLVTGFNPLNKCSLDFSDDNCKIGTVKRVDLTTSGSGVNGMVDVPVYQAPLNVNGKYKVIDVTPTMQANLSVTQEVLEHLTCVKGKYTPGQAEQIYQIFSSAQATIDDPERAIKWPEFLNADRSTLTHANGLNSKYDLNLHNDMEQYIEFMHYLQESEIMYYKSVVGLKNARANLTAFRRLTGVNRKHPYFKKVFKGDPINPLFEGGAYTALSYPTAAQYACSKASPRSFTTDGKWVMAQKKFWSDIEVAISIIVEGAAADSLMKRVRVQKDAVAAIEKALTIGIVSDTALTAAVGKLPGIVGMVFGFDPNDLICEEQYTDPLNRNVYPACGYLNVYTRTDLQNGQNMRYSIIPTWMQVLNHFMNSRNDMTRILKGSSSAMDLTTTKPTSGGFTRFSFQNEDSYMPIVIDTLEPQYFDFIFLEAVTLYSDRIFSGANQMSALFRFIAAEKLFGVDMLQTDDLTPLSSALERYLGSLSTYALPEKITSILDLPECPDEALDFLDSVHNHQIMHIHTDPLVPTSNQEYRAFGGKDVVVNGLGDKVYDIIGFRPNWMDAHARNAQGWDFVSPVHRSGDTDILGQPLEPAIIECGEFSYLESAIAVFNPGGQDRDTSKYAFLPLAGSNVRPNTIDNMETHFDNTEFSTWIANISSSYNESTSGAHNDYAPFNPLIAYRNLDPRGTISVSMPLDDVDPRLNYFSANPDKALYGKDTLNLTPFADAYVVIKDNAADIDPLNGFVSSQAFDDYATVPVLFNTSSQSLTGGSFNNTRDIDIALLSNSPGARNAVTDKNDAPLNFREVHGVGIIQAMATNPSLYGYIRQAAKSAISAKWDPILGPTLPINANPGLTESQTSIVAPDVWAFLPNTVDYSEAATSAVNAQSATDWMYHAIQNMVSDAAFPDSPTETDPNKRYDDSKQLWDILSATSGNAGCNMPLQVALISSNTDNIIIDMPVDPSNGNTRHSGIIGQTLNSTINPRVALAYTDARTRLMRPYTRSMPFGEPLLLMKGELASTFEDDLDFFFKSNAAENQRNFMWIGDYKLASNILKESKNYANDVRTFLHNKPPVYLNKLWYLFGVHSSPFEAQFRGVK